MASPKHEEQRQQITQSTAVSDTRQPFSQQPLPSLRPGNSGKRETEDQYNVSICSNLLTKNYQFVARVVNISPSNRATDCNQKKTEHI